MKKITNIIAVFILLGNALLATMANVQSVFAQESGVIDATVEESQLAEVSPEETATTDIIEDVVEPPATMFRILMESRSVRRIP